MELREGAAGLDAQHGPPSLAFEHALGVLAHEELPVQPDAQVQPK